MVCAVGASSEVVEVEEYLFHPRRAAGRHADEGLHARCRLVVRRSKSTTNVLVVENLDLEGEVLLQVLYYHHQERQLYAQGLLRVGRARYKRSATHTYIYIHTWTLRYKDTQKALLMHKDM